MLNERFYPVNKNTGISIDTGKFVPGWRPGYVGYYYNFQKYKGESPNDRRVWVKNFDDYNDRDFFEKAVEAKGPAAQLAYKYGIMKNYENKEDRVKKWLASDSYYDEDSFFYVTGVPGYEGKKIAFQLRISNHYINPTQWFLSHVDRLYTLKGSFGRKKQMAQFALGLMVGRVEEKEDMNFNYFFYDNEQADMFQKYGLTFYEVDLDFTEKTPEQEKLIDDFLTRIGNDEYVTISFKELEYMFGTFPPPNNYGGTKYDDINFTEREKIKGRRFKPYPFKDEMKTDKPLIPLETIEDVVEDKNTERRVIDGVNYYLFNYKGIDLALDYDKMKAYRMPRRRGTLLDKVIYTDEYPIEESKKILKLSLTENDIKYMVTECVKQIKKRRLV